jgi:hypothetical protein
VNIINTLGETLSRKRKKILDGDYTVKFSDKEEIEFSFKCLKSSIVNEKLIIDGDEKIDRKETGEGKIWSVELDDFLKFKISQDELAINGKKDSIQHPFIDKLTAWGKGVRCYRFGSEFGKDSYVFDVKKNLEEEKSYPEEFATTVFIEGVEKFKEKYRKAIIEDMKKIGYEIEDVGVKEIPNIYLKPINRNLSGLFVKEKDLKCETNQVNMSQGMFRALALIIQVNFSIYAGESTCIIIDDIGEGLDYDRSKELITLLISKVKKSKIQLIMSTNDRFVMNNVPLEYWIVLTRDGNYCKALNYRNSKEIFDDFAFSGLSNFDFFTGKYYMGEKS